jgi:hypothetical protein
MLQKVFFVKGQKERQKVVVQHSNCIIKMYIMESQL